MKRKAKTKQPGQRRIPRIAYARFRAGLSLNDLAHRARVDAPTLSKIERGRLLPYPSQLARVAAALGVRRERLLEPVRLPVL